jgi:sporulation protein YlmC with PRC-barrel domain
MQASRLKDMPVVSMAEGAKVGNVVDVLFDPADLRLVALGLTGASGQAIVPFGALRAIGADAVTIADVAATQAAGGQTALGGARRLDDLLGLPVVNGEGAVVGTIEDLEVDAADGRLTALVAHRGGVLGLGGTRVSVPASAVRGVGPKLVTVDAPAPAEGR